MSTDPTDETELEARCDPKAAADGDERPIEVECRESGLTVEVPPGRSILSCLEAAGVPVPSSCREGTCGSCEAEVLEGTPDHRDTILFDEEKAAGDVMMICVSRALTDRLVLDL